MLGYYRGDTHVHTIFSQSILEFGNPIAATKEAAKSIGIEWVVVTDHSSDFDNWKDNSIDNAWERIGQDVDEVNAADPSIVFIKGLEVSLLNAQRELVHFLAYPNPNIPDNLPYLGDGGGDIQLANYTARRALTTLEEIGGFAYSAHPFATEDDIPVVGGLWNIGDGDFPFTGQMFDVGGFVLCNKVSEPSDLISNDDNKWIQDRLKGGQIWGDRYSLIGDVDPYDPYNIKEASGAGDFEAAPEGDANYLNRYRQGEQVINFMNTKGLRLKNENEDLENFKYYFSAGSDAHGSF